MEQSTTTLLSHLRSLGLSQFQIDNLSRTIVDYLLVNQQDRIERPSICPCCNKETKIYKRGRRKDLGKQRFSCCGCDEWFTYDIHQITYRSVTLEIVCCYR